MLPGIICTIKTGKLCRCYCLSRGINACILILSAAGSCWMPSGWFSHPPGTPVTASAHAEICTTFLSRCQHPYCGKVRTLYWTTRLPKVALFPSLWNRYNLWLIKVPHASWFEHILLSASPWSWPHDLSLSNFLLVFTVTLKDQQDPRIRRVHSECHPSSCRINGPVHTTLCLHSNMAQVILSFSVVRVFSFPQNVTA